MFGYAIAAATGAFGVGACWFGYLAVKKGGAWAIAEIKAWWGAGKADLAAIKSDLTSIESRVTALEKKAPAAPPAPAPAPAAA